MTVFGGNPTYVDDVNQLELHRRGDRASASSAANSATEVGVLRIDNLNLKAGRAYEVRTGNLRWDLTNATDRVKATLRYSSAGSATNSSSEIGRWESAAVGDLNSGAPVVGWIFPTADEPTASVRLSISRPSGSGTVTLMSDTGHGIQLRVFCHGVDPGDTGIDE